VAGLDWPVSSNLMLGGALAFGSDHFHVDAGLGKGKSTSFQLGVYGAVQFTPRIYGTFLGSFGQNAISTERILTVSGTDDLAASLTSQKFVARYETGIDLHWIKPYAAVEDRLALMPAYNETSVSGSGNFALSYGANTVNALDVELGFRNQADLPMNRNWTLHLSDRLAWQHGSLALMTPWPAIARLPARNSPPMAPNLARISLCGRWVPISKTATGWISG
jgi:outer membrane autotransporter protein